MFAGSVLIAGGAHRPLATEHSLDVAVGHVSSHINVEQGLMKSGHLIIRILDSCVHVPEEVGTLRAVLCPSASLVPQGSGKSFRVLRFRIGIQDSTKTPLR